MGLNLELGLSGPDLPALFRRVQEVFLPGAPPTLLSLSGRRRRVTSRWLEESSAQVKDYFIAEWEGRGWMSLDRDTIVKISLEDYDLKPARLLQALADVPFYICSAATIHPEWAAGALGEEYAAPSFGDLHWRHGWGCLFRGDGHARLVSRRWLTFGPWRLLHGANDTTLVQFHDLEAEAATALSEARPGHERMGISRIGGFIQADFHYSHDLKGLYYAGERKLHLVVPNGEEVTQRQMLDACAARFYQILGPAQPIENVVYVFVDEQQARVHLHELWLRDLECRAFIDGVEVNVTDDYHPTPVKLEWVVRLGESDDPMNPRN